VWGRGSGCHWSSTCSQGTACMARLRRLDTHRRRCSPFWSSYLVVSLRCLGTRCSCFLLSSTHPQCMMSMAHHEGQRIWACTRSVQPRCFARTMMSTEGNYFSPHFGTSNQPGNSRSLVHLRRCRSSPHRTHIRQCRCYQLRSWS
jgi:hypothetical protein